MLRDCIYVMDVLDSTDMPIPVAEIETKIWDAAHDADARRSHGEEPVPVGVLTAYDRDTWAEVWSSFSVLSLPFTSRQYLDERSSTPHLIP